MDWATIQTALVTWAEGATGLTFVWEGQDMPKRAYPVGVLNIIAESSLGQDETRYEYDADADELIPHINGNRAFTLSLQVKALAPPEGATGVVLNHLASIRASFKKAATKAAFKAAGLAFVAVDGSQLLPEQVDGRWIARGVLNVNLATVEHLTDSNVDHIETVELTGTLDDAEQAPDVLGEE